MIHALTGCDVVSSFGGKGKKSYNSVNEARKNMFSRGTRALENIPFFLFNIFGEPNWGSFFLLYAVRVLCMCSLYIYVG